MAPTISRRSMAMGCRRAMVRIDFSSMSRCIVSIVGSVAITRSASSVSRSSKACAASEICFSTRPPISATLRMISCRSLSKALAVWSTLVLYSVIRSPEAAGYIVLRALILRRGEHFACRVELDQFAEIHESGEVGYARGLLHVMSNDDDRIIIG